MTQFTLGDGLETLRWHITLGYEVRAAYGGVYKSTVFWDMMSCSLLEIYTLSK
jgi:hypothetical protein